MQLSALQSRMEAVKAAENAVRTERHDLRHRLQAVAQLVARGEQVEALDFLDAAQTRLEEHKVTRWCRPPVLDAVFASCFEQAKSQDIPVEASISLPDELPVDERAGHRGGQRAGQRHPRQSGAARLPPVHPLPGGEHAGRDAGDLNPCAGDVTFDSSGLPLARREGHGLGVQSISAFCRKNGAVCRFDLTDGWFRLQLVL